MDTKDIIIKYLNENGFDGLFNFDAPCGCLATDLAPCGNLSSDCKPGYKIICKPEDCDGCICDCGGPADGKKWGITRHKEA